MKVKKYSFISIKMAATVKLLILFLLQQQSLQLQSYTLSKVLFFYLSREDSHLFQVVSDSKFVSVRVQSPTEINAPRGCAVIL